MSSKAVRAGVSNPESRAGLLAEALRSQALFETGALTSCIACLIASFRRHLPECSVVVVTVDRATQAVEGVECSDGVADEAIALAIAGISKHFPTLGLDGGPVPPSHPLPNMDPALWICREISEPLASVIIVWRESGFGAFGALDVSMVAEFAEAVAATLRLRISHDGETVNRLCTLLDQCGMAFIVLDGAMNLQRANSRGEKMLDACDYFTRVGGRLEVSNAALGARVRGHIANLLAQPPAPGALGLATMVLPLQNRNDASLIKATVLRLRTVEDQLAGPAVAALVIPFAEPDGVLTSGDLLDMGFTRAEADLAVALLAGVTVKDYAKARGRAVPTVRAHLKRVMMRLKVHRQADLVRVLLGIKRSGAL